MSKERGKEENLVPRRTKGLRGVAASPGNFAFQSPMAKASTATPVHPGTQLAAGSQGLAARW